MQKKQEAHYHPFSPEYQSLKKQAEKEFKFLDDKVLKKKLISLFIQNLAMKMELAIDLNFLILNFLLFSLKTVLYRALFRLLCLK